MAILLWRAQHGRGGTMSNWTLYEGDCIEVIKGLPQESVDAVVTSPPYAMQRAKLYGGVPEDEYPNWTVAWMREVRRLLKPQGSVLINIREHIRNGEMSDYVHRTRLALREDGWIECDELIWIKRGAPPVGHTRRPRRSWERILWFSPSRNPHCDPKANGNPSGRIGMMSGKGYLYGLSDQIAIGPTRCRDWVNVEVERQSIPHPAVYPQRLASWMIRLVTPPGGTVLDPFAGSGTTLLAAVQEGFSCIGIEKEPEYCEIIRQRMQEAVQVALPGVASSRKGMNLAPISLAMVENEARFVPDVCAGGAVQQELKFA